MTMHRLSFSLWLFASLLLPLVSHAQTSPVVGWDARSLTVDARRVVPVMGEIHYSRLPEGVTRLELRILPLQPDEPVYFPQEADTTPGEAVRAMSLLQQ